MTPAARFVAWIYVAAGLLAIAVILSGCTALGVPTTKTFEDKAYVTVASVESVQKVSASLVRLKKIDANTGQGILDATDRAMAGVAIARTVSLTNPTDAVNRLAAIDAALATLQGYLSDSAAGSKNLPLLVPSILTPVK